MSNLSARIHSIFLNWNTCEGQRKSIMIGHMWIYWIVFYGIIVLITNPYFVENFCTKRYTAVYFSSYPLTNEKTTVDMCRVPMSWEKYSFKNLFLRSIVTENDFDIFRSNPKMWFQNLFSELLKIYSKFKDGYCHCRV